jgi:hypothetical protein
MADLVLTRDTRDPLMGLSREQFESKLKAQLAHRVDQVWAFGSYASGQLGPQSDVDLILVCPTTLPFPIRSREFADLLDIGFWQNVTGSLKKILPLRGEHVDEHAGFEAFGSVGHA